MLKIYPPEKRSAKVLLFNNMTKKTNLFIAICRKIVVVAKIHLAKKTIKRQNGQIFVRFVHNM